jgi:hypothetical protein
VLRIYLWQKQWGQLNSLLFKGQQQLEIKSVPKGLGADSGDWAVPAFLQFTNLTFGF